MPASDIRNQIVSFLEKANSSVSLNKKPTTVKLEAFKNQKESNYLPLIDIQSNKKWMNKSVFDHALSEYEPSTPNFPDDKISKIYILGLSCLALFILTKVCYKK